MFIVLRAKLSRVEHEKVLLPLEDDFLFILHRMKEDEWFVVRWEELENLRKRDVLSKFCLCQRNLSQ